jgi:P4 family phage/plasmid primase-like protien
MKTKECFSSVLEAARAYVKRGYYVVPIPSGKNHPVVPGWQKLRLRLGELKERFSGAAGIGLLLKPSKRTDVDIDCREARVAADHLLPDTAMVHGRRGNPRSHRYYLRVGPASNQSYADPRRGAKGERAMLVELRAVGVTVTPPSHHARTGELIEWEAFGEPTEIDPERLLKAVAKVAAAALLGRYWPEGSRHRAALALAGMLLRAGWTEKTTKRFLRAVAAAAKDEETSSRLQDVVTTASRIRDGENVTGAPTLAELIGDDIVTTIRKWLELGTSDIAADSEAAPHNSDLGNAQRLVAQHGQAIRYCHHLGEWLVWKGGLWTPDKSGEIICRAKQTIRNIYAEAAQLPQENTRTILVKHALHSEAASRIKSMVELAQSEPGIPVAIDQLDADPWLLNCANGTIDLRTGKLLPHDRNNLCTKQVLVNFDPQAECPTWKVFLNRIMDGNKHLIRFLQRAIGHSLTGMTMEQVVFILYGTGANGKSTFIETVRSLLGDYAQQSEFETFLVRKNGGGPRNDIARLKGTRFVSAVEAEQGCRLSETIIKQVTGGDKITARFLYHEFFEFTPQFKLFLVSNHKPRIVGTDEALWRRIRLIPFAVTIPRHERDLQLLDKLRRELPGILAWALRGCLNWLEKGLGEPSEVAEATSEYRQEEDFLAAFLADKCIADPKGTASAGLLYKAYESWCADNGEEPAAQKVFGSELGSRGFSPGKKHGKRCRKGLRLRTEDDVG